MKAILVHAPVEKVVEEYDAPSYPHIGLAYVATYGNKRGLDCKVVDCKFERIDLDELLDRLEEFRDEKEFIVGYTAMTHEISRVNDVAKEVKRIFPQSLSILGGVHVTALTDQCLEEFEVFDIGVTGEGEKTFLNLVNSITDHATLKEVPGIVYRDNGNIICNQETGLKSDLDEIGFPDWSLFPKAKEYPINIGRGCPVPCVFCMRASGTESRFRSVENILEEINELNNNYQLKMIHFFGDDFAANKELTHKLLDGLMTLRDKISWRAGMRVSHIDKEMLQKMKRAGCEHFEIGVESGNKKILKGIKKGISLRKVEEVVKFSKEVGLDCWCYFILGHPNENWDTAMDTVNFLCKINPTNAAIGIMVPYPGTEVWEMAKRGEEGYRLLSTDWRDFNKQIGNALELDSLSRRQLELLQLYGYIKFFVVNLRIIDFMKFCLQYRKEAVGFLKNFFTKSNRFA